MAVSSSGGTGNSTMFSLDSGNTWSLGTDLQESLYSVATDRRGNWIAVGYTPQGQIIFSLDGQTWNKTSNQPVGVLFIDSIATDNNGTWVSVGYSGDTILWSCS